MLRPYFGHLRRLTFGLVLGFGLCVTQTQAAGTDTHLLNAIPTGKHSVLEGIRAVIAEGAVPISVKLEFEAGRLWLSAYGAKAGLDHCAERNELFELKGLATEERWEARREVFRDKEHVARASTQLTLLQTSTITLDAALAKIEALHAGTIYSVVPTLMNGRTTVVVLTRSPKGQSVQYTFDGST